MPTKALILCRVSGKKQTKGDSLDDQEKKALKLALQHGYKTEEIKIFREIYSGRKDIRPLFEEMINYGEQHQKTVEKIFVFDIDRLTRAGAESYIRLKQRVSQLGIRIVDVGGVIQEEKNTLEGIGGKFGNDLKYSWSVISPSESAEIAKAQQAKEEIQKTMVRTIPRMIENIQNGYEAREAGYGFRNIKTLDENTGKKRALREINPEEAVYVRKMYDLVCQGLPTREICDKINQMGFRTRQYNKWNTDRSKVIGKTGGKKLTPKQLWRFIENVSYAGFKCETWTWKHLVKARHANIVSIEQWNTANEQKYKIIEDIQEGSLTGWTLIDQSKNKEVRKYQKNNPDFPYKNLIKCPVCGKKMKGAYSKGKSGKKYPFYFCNRGHKQVSINPKELENALREMFSELKFTKEIATFWEDGLRELWLTELKTLNKGIMDVSDRIKQLREETEALFKKIEILTNETLIKRTEQEYEAIQEEIILLESQRAEKEYSEKDINRIVKLGRRFVEHLDELLLDTTDNATLKGFWKLIFTQTPTLEEIQNRTPQISPVVELKATLKSFKRQLVAQMSFGSNTFVEEMENRTSQISPIVGLKGTLKTSKRQLVAPLSSGSNTLIEELERWAGIFEHELAGWNQQ